MLSVALLLASVMVLSRIAFLASRHATGAEDRTQAQMHCQNIMQELLAGVRPMQNVPPRSFEGDQWVYMVNVEPVEGSSLSTLVVLVDRLDDENGQLPTEDEMEGYRLVRWVRTDKLLTQQLEDKNRPSLEPVDDAVGAEGSVGAEGE